MIDCNPSSGTNLALLLGDDATPPAVSPQAPIPATLGEAEVSRLLGIGASRLRTLARDGVAVRVGNGTYDVRATLARYLEQLRTHAARAGRAPEGGDEYKAERVLLVAAQREAQEMKNAVMRGDLVSAEDVTQGWASILTDVRAGVLAVPARLADLTPDQRGKLDAEIRLALERLSHG
ncbi:MAG: DNA packaging protein [Paracoccaceae bacterium]